MGGLGVFYDANLTLIQASLVGMVLAAGVQVAMRAGVFSLAAIGFWGLGGYTSGILARDHGAGTAVALLAAVLLSGGLGYVLALLFVRLKGMYMAMATVAFDLVIIVVALRLEDLTGGALGLYGVPAQLGMGPLVALVALVAAALAWSERGHLGRTIGTVGVDTEMAGALGIGVRAVQRRAFVASSMLGGLAGGMSAQLFNTVSTDQFGFPLITLALTMAVIGGLGSWSGAYVGAVIVYWLPELLRPIADWRDVVFGTLLIVFVALEPRGLLGLLARGRQALRHRSSRSEAKTETIQEVTA